jgi:hypothetical protein
MTHLYLVLRVGADFCADVDAFVLEMEWRRRDECYPFDDICTYAKKSK